MKVSVGIATLMLGMFPLAVAAASSKPTIVLVHGALETSAVWGQVVSILNHDGYAVKNIDLPGRPGNEMAMSQVTLEAYRQTVAKAIEDERYPVVLVGHSFGGLTISAEAEAEPEKIKTLVYIAAYLPQSGQSLLSMATSDKGSKLGPVLSINKEKGYAFVSPRLGGTLFANDASPAVQAVVARAVVNEPLAPLATPVTLTPARFGAVDKVTIRTLRDEVISPPFQVEMSRLTPVRLQMTINTGHTPFITQPGILATEIEKAVN